jgi:hypothetical protein
VDVKLHEEGQHFQLVQSSRFLSDYLNLGLPFQGLNTALSSVDLLQEGHAL